METIDIIAARAGIDQRYVEPYGRYMAKIDPRVVEPLKDKPNGKLVLVTAITPTKAGEGKTTTSIALAEGLGRIGQKALLVLREPSLGPVFGIKGGATGGGKASLYPSEEINLHFTGDMHALTSSINLISAIIDNHLFQGNELGIDPQAIVWPRAMDMNDRSLREIEVGLGTNNGIPHRSSFVITVASELMAILCLSEDANDFQKRTEQIIVAYNHEGHPIRVGDFHISSAIMRLMAHALQPNLVQTLEGNPVLVHGGPFANIAHGCNSVIATKMALKLAPIVVTEAGFGADLGAEKFLDIKCRLAGLHPDLVVMVATIRALKMHGGQEGKVKDIDALIKGCANLQQHLENMKKFGLPPIVAINHFADDDEEEIAALKAWCQKQKETVVFLDGFLKGGEGSTDLARLVQEKLSSSVSRYHPLYELEWPITKKIETICQEIYRASSVTYTPQALEDIKRYTALGYENLPICMAKTPQSFSDNPRVLNAPRDFSMTVREIRLSAGAGFLVALTGNILTMPGLPKVPAAVSKEKDHE